MTKNPLPSKEEKKMKSLGYFPSFGGEKTEKKTIYNGYIFKKSMIPPILKKTKTTSMDD